MSATIDPLVRQLVDRLIVPALVDRFLREHRAVADDEKPVDVPVPVELPPTP